MLNLTEFLHGNKALVTALAILLDSSTAAIPSIINLQSSHLWHLWTHPHRVRGSCFQRGQHVPRPRQPPAEDNNHDEDGRFRLP
mmetsp:Transcript_45900/g.111189  ORF Transcript_45900/g.111189 Transcript_45900/m.111189 type:complete len:84 (+) Transcript_45900:56-307(+)